MTQLLRTAADFNMEIQPQLVLLQKTLLYIEGLGRQLYPQLDLWETAQPFMQRWAGATWAAGGVNTTAGASAKAGRQSASTARAAAPRYPTVAHRAGPATPDSRP